MLEPDRDQIEIFVDALFRHAGPEGFVSLRAFYEDDSKKPFRISPISRAGNFKFLIDAIEDDARRAANDPKPIVFCPPLAVFSNRERAREQDILKGLALSVECDQHAQQALCKLEAIIGKPTLIVRSGGKWIDPATEQVHDKLHLHWRLTVPAGGEALHKLKQARDLATRLVGGDPSNKPVCHPIRWAGSWHRKADPVLCEIEEANPDEQIDLDTALAALIAASPAPAEKTTKGNGHDAGPAGEPTDWTGPVQGIISGADYHNATVVLAAKFRAAGMSDGAAVNALRALMESSTGPHDGRWATRYADIPRAVATASEKFRTNASDGKPQEPEQDISAQGLQTMTFNPIKYVVPGIVVEGLTLFAGKPKIGKSWLLLHAAIAVGRGGFTLGEIHCQEGDALYCALEDNLRRLKSRMGKLIGEQPWPPRLKFRCQLPRLADGGLVQIRDWIAKADHPRLVIIDTLAMVRAPKKKDQGAYDADYAAGQELRGLANETGVAIVLVHHLRKAEADDAFDTVSGTLGLTGAPDTVLVLRRDTAGNTVLHGRGRDLIEFEKAVTFDKSACTWTIAGEVSEVRTSGERKAIIEAITEIGAPASPFEIAAIARLKPANVRRMLARMAKDGLVRRCEYGRYALVSETAPAAE